MKTKTVLILFILINLIFRDAYVFSQDNEKIIDQMFIAFNQDDAPGASVMVIKDHKIVFSKGYGMADVENKVKATTATNYRLASVTKQFTAMAIMMLAEAGKLNMEDKLTDIFPDFPAYGKQITIDDIVHHRSGFIHYEDIIPENQTEQLRDKDVLTMMKGVDSTYFEPGSHYKYSNSGYAVLAMIVEKKSGLKFEEFLKEKIFRPLEMNTTIAFVKNKEEVKNRAFGHTETGNGWKKTDQNLTSAVLGDGGIYCSVEDYYKWDNALYTTKLAGKDAMKEIFLPGLLTDGSQIDDGYAFGWRTDYVRGHKVHSHRGLSIGFTNKVIRIPDLKLTVLILTNRNEDMDNVERKAYEIANLYTNNIFKSSVGEELEKMIFERGIDAAINQYPKLKNNCKDLFYFSDLSICDLGYRLIARGRKDEAIKILELAKKDYPASKAISVALKHATL